MVLRDGEHGARRVEQFLRLRDSGEQIAAVLVLQSRDDQVAEAVPADPGLLRHALGVEELGCRCRLVWYAGYGPCESDR